MPPFKLEVLLVWVLYIPSVIPKYTPILDPGFFFDYNKPGQPVPIPVTEQCEMIHITWGRSTARGANPVAPYFMQVFTSTFITPFVIPVGNGLTFDWDVPFAPGTQYQICMFDKNGLTGGCQAMYTVIQNSTTSTPTCQNVTAPTTLQVQATVPGGPMSQYGFIDQCTDVTITPKSGKPPFILTVSPSLHPPYNITSDSMNPITWTVSLSWAFPFFISLSSADGQLWSNGPLHAGGFGPSDCLAPGSIPQKSATAMAVGAGVGSVIGGLVLGVLCAYLHGRYFRHRAQALHSTTHEQKEPPDEDSHEDGRPLPLLPSSFRRTTIGPGSSVFAIGGRPQTVTVEPYTTSPSAGHPAESPKSRQITPQEPTPPRRNSTWPGLPPRPPIRTRTLTYVIHEDAEQMGTPDLENIVELPPRYIRNPKRADTL